MVEYLTKYLRTWNQINNKHRNNPKNYNRDKKTKNRKTD